MGNDGTEDTPSGVLQVEHLDAGVVVVTLDRPDSRNALNNELRQRIIDVLTELVGDEGVLAVVLTGMGQDGLDGCRDISSAGGQVVSSKSMRAHASSASRLTFHFSVSVASRKFAQSR